LLVSRGAITGIWQVCEQGNQAKLF
jgi:hypothetical protein